MSVASQIPAVVRLAAERHATGDELAVLFVPWDPGPRAPNRMRGRYWAEVARADETAKLAAAWAYRMAGDPANAEPVLVDVIVLRGAEMDEDNIRNALKPVADYLFHGRLAPDDTRRFVRWGSVTVIAGAVWANSRAWTVLLVRAR